MTLESFDRASGATPEPHSPVRLHLVKKLPPEPATCEEALREYARDLLAYVRRRIRDPELACDVVQETLLRAYRARHAFDTTKPVWPWLATIARNLILNSQRDERRRRRYVQAQLDLHEIEQHADPNADVDPEKSYTTAQRRVAIKHALASLTPRQRRVLMLRAADDFSYEDIAVFEGITVNAVKSLLKRARRAFRDVYGLFEPGTESAVAATHRAASPSEVIGARNADHRLTAS